MKKIGIIGIGSVGGAIASALTRARLARELILIDRSAARTNAAALDLTHAAAFGETPMKIKAGSYKDLTDAEIIIIAAGANQKPGQSRTDLAAANAAVMRDIISELRNEAAAAPDRRNRRGSNGFARKNSGGPWAEQILIIVTNPLDSMVMLAQKLSKLPAGRVIGTGTMLDGARLRSLLAEYFGVSPGAVHANVLGEHGDSGFVNWTGSNIGAFAKTLPGAKKTAIEKSVRNAAYEIIKGRGATWDGIAAAASDLVRCIANDERRMLTVSVSDAKNAAHSLPRVIGRGGVVETLPANLSAAEKKSLSLSIKAIAKTFAGIRN